MTKGAPNVILDVVSKDDPEVLAPVMSIVHELGLRGIRSLAVARTTKVSQSA